MKLKQQTVYLDNAATTRIKPEVLEKMQPFLSEKYDLTKHPNYRLTAGYDKKNTFDIEAFLSHRLKLKPNDEYTVIDADNC